MTKTVKKPNLVLVSIIYLAGIFMGAIDTGIVTPARTLIQSNLSVNDQTGIWMITIYTLAYAASIPIMGKLADKFGRKYIYLTCISLFGIGSLFCGLSQSFCGFSLLLAARVVQAIGGGGILPIATAEFGTSFPENKRGMALGLVGGVYGIANIFGASAGSLILNIFGQNNWQFIFYVNVPISLFVLLAGFISLQNAKNENRQKTDVFGILTLTAMILSLLYGLKNLDFFAIAGTIINLDVYPFLLLFVLLLPLFIFIEVKADDPVMNLKYFTSRNILITLIMSFLSGIVMMGMIFVPQFSENALKIATGSGGYLVIILGVFAGVSAPVSGKLIDQFGVKIVLGFGFLVSVIGSVFTILVTTAAPGFLTVAVSLILIGIGIGFTMGTPLNYMMLENTDEKQSNSALATLSLVRSIGTAIAPAIMIGFIAHAGGLVQTNVMDLLPKEVTVPALPYVQDITDELNQLKSNEQMKDKLAGMEMPDLTSMTKMEINMGGDSNYEMPADLVKLMQNSDVTTITANTVTLTERMFAEMTPDIIEKIQTGIGKGIDGIAAGRTQMEDAVKQMEEGEIGNGQGIAGMEQGVKAQKAALEQLQTVSKMFAQMGNPALPPTMTIADMIPANVKSSIPQSALDELAKLKSVDDLNAKMTELQNAISVLEGKIADSEKSQADMNTVMTPMKATIAEMNDLSGKMTSLKDAVPGAFETAKENYVVEIKKEGPQIEKSFQSTLNGGYKNVYLTSAIAAALALLVLVFYRKKRKNA
ncbi:MAG: MFS transporter [Clostridiaceae bacterium]|nr:MFS transporter [Clostridiaceae bacterium]